MMELSKEYLKMKSEAASGTPRRTIHNAAVATVCAHNNAQVSTGKKVRHVFIEAHFPELKGGRHDAARRQNRDRQRLGGHRLDGRQIL